MLIPNHVVLTSVGALAKGLTGSGVVVAGGGVLDVVSSLPPPPQATSVKLKADAIAKEVKTKFLEVMGCTCLVSLNV